MPQARTKTPAPLPASEPLRWHPRLLAHTTAHEQVVLLEDGDAVLLAAGPTNRVALAVSAGASAREVLELERSVTAQAGLQRALDQLVAHDLVLAAASHRDQAPRYVVPQLHAAPRTVKVSEHAEVVLFSSHLEGAPIVGWARALAAAHRSAVALVDDALDPRLLPFDRERRSRAESWLLVVARGRAPSLGPWISAGPGAMCCRCLQQRVLGNQPVRRWVMHQAGVSSLAVPVAAAPLHPARLPPPALDPALRHRLRSGSMVRLHEAGEHHVARSEHCPVCGRLPRGGPLELRSTPRARDPDGGYRVHPAQDTLARLSRHVSAVTGLVADVSVLPDQAAAAVPIHRSALLTCPLSQPTVVAADFHRVALGKGLTAAQSRASALGEALERSCAQYRGDEPMVLGTADELGDRHLSTPPQLQPRGDAQRDARAPQWRSDEPMHWVELYSLTHARPALAPATFCYANTPWTREQRRVPFDSNGCAAGRTLEEALLQGLLEVIERDAVAIWWYNRLVLPGLSPSVLRPAALAILRRTIEPTWQWWLLDATHDLGTPVVVAVARRRDDGQFRLGFGGHVEATVAAERATTELCQLIALGQHGGGRFDFASVADQPYLRPCEPPSRPGLALPCSTSYEDIRDAITAGVGRLRGAGLELLAHVYPRIDDALVVLKAIVPGACHIWPQLGTPRLRRVPVELGWAPSALAEHELNPLALFV